MTAATSTTDPPAEGFYLLFLDLFRGGLAAIIAGFVFLGAGSRVVMRISALLNPEARGVITANENVIGEITLGGTIGLVLFIGLFGGLMAGALWVLVRDWLPERLLARALLGGGIALALAGSAAIEADNIDFHMLHPAWLHVVMFAALFFATGAATALADHWLKGRLPADRTACIVFAGLTMLAAVPIIAALIGAFFADGSGLTMAAGVCLVVVSLASVAGWTRYVRGRGAPSSLRPIAIGALAGACVLSSADLAQQIGRIV